MLTAHPCQGHLGGIQLGDDSRTRGTIILPGSKGHYFVVLNPPDMRVPQATLRPDCLTRKREVSAGSLILIQHPEAVQRIEKERRGVKFDEMRH